MKGKSSRCDGRLGPPPLRALFIYNNTTVSAPAVGVHGRRHAAADGVSECHAPIRTSD